MIELIYVIAFGCPCDNYPSLVWEKSGSSKPLLSREQGENGKEEVALRTRGYIAIPLRRFHSGYLGVDVKIEGNTFLFLLDTGSPVTHVDPNRTGRLNAKWEATGAAKWKTQKTGYLSPMTIGEVPVGASVPVGAFDLTPINEILKVWGDPEADGLLGGDLLRAFRAVIDYGKPELHLLKKKEESYEGRPIMEWFRDISNANPFVRVRASHALQGIAREFRTVHPKLVPILRTALKDPDETVRRNAAWALITVGSEGASCLQELRGCLEDPFSAVRGNAAEAIGSIGADAAGAVPDLIRVLKDDHWAVRLSAAMALGRIGPKAKDALPALARCLKDAEEEVRIHSAAAIGQIGQASKQVLSELVDLMTDKSWRVRREAMQTVRFVATDRKALVPAFIRALKDSNEVIQDHAADTLVHLSPASVSPLISALQDKDHTVRYRAAWVLGMIGREASPAVEPLSKTLKDPDARVRARAAAALGGIGPEAKLAVPALLDVLKDDNENVRQRAMEALNLVDAEAWRKHQ